MLLGNAAEFQVAHKGCNKWQEPFDAILNNAKVVKVFKPGEEPCNGCLLVATKCIQPGAKVAAPRDRNFWCYRNNFDSLDDMGMANCMAFYDIKNMTLYFNLATTVYLFHLRREKDILDQKSGGGGRN